MATVKEYNNKLARLRSSKKMTRTMKMVSATKLRKALEVQANLGPYLSRLDDLAAMMSSGAADDAHALIAGRRNVRNVLLVVIASDRGLCGGFNNNLNKRALEWINEARESGKNVQLDVCGRRASLFFRSRIGVRKYHEDLTARPQYSGANRLGAEMRELFLSGVVDEIHVAYNVNPSVMSHRPVISRLLPLESASVGTGRGNGVSSDAAIYEPEKSGLLGFVLPMVVNARLYSVLVSNSVGEHGARMTAMDSATRNADTLTEKITLLRNRARQSAITTQLIEIVAGAEAQR